MATASPMRSGSTPATSLMHPMSPGAMAAPNLEPGCVQDLHLHKPTNIPDGVGDAPGDRLLSGGISGAPGDALMGGLAHRSTRGYPFADLPAEHLLAGSAPVLLHDLNGSDVPDRLPSLTTVVRRRCALLPVQ